MKATAEIMMANQSILIIEDEKYLRHLYSEILGNYAVETVKDGFEALNKERRYDLYIVDIGLPGMDGLKTIKKIRETYDGLKAIIVTGHDVTNYSTELEDGMIKGVLQKPFNISNLLAVVQAALEMDKG